MRKSLLLLCLIGNLAAGQLFGQTQIVANGSSTAPILFPGAGCTYSWTNDQPSIGLPAGSVGNIASFTALNPTASPVVASITATPASTVFAYIPNSQDNTVSVVNTVSRTVVATIPVGQNPGCVSISPDGSKVFIGNNGSFDVSVISTATNTVIATIPVGASPNGIVVDHAGTTAYVTTPAGIKNIDVATNTFTGTTNVSGNLFGIVMNPTDDEYGYTVGYGTPGTVLQVDFPLDAVNFGIFAGNVPYAVAVTPDNSRLYVVNVQSGTVSVVNRATATVIGTIPVGTDPHGAAISPDGTTVYVTNTSDGTISVINTATNTVTGTIPCGAGPFGINISADGTLLYVAAANSLQAISVATHAVLSTTPVGQDPMASGNFLTPPTTCSATPVTFTITVTPSANVSAGTVAGYISSCAGSPSASPALQQFKVNGTALTGDVTATAPAGFEVSLSLNSGFGPGVTLTPAAGVLTNAVVYVRSAANAPAGYISGNVILSAGGVTQQSIGVTGFINSLATLDQAPNQVVLNGDPTAAVNFTGTGNAYTWTNNTPGIGLAGNGTGNIPGFTAINTGTAPIVATISVTTKNAGYAYIGETLNGNVTFINTSTHAIVDSVATGNFPYGMWQTPNGGLLYVANGVSGNISVINTATRAVTATIPVGRGPIGLVGSADGSTLYVVQQTDNTVSVVNTATELVTATIPVGGLPEAICMSLDGSTIYVTNQGDNSISVISTATNSVVATILVGSNPEAICVSPDGTKLYEVNDGDNNLYVISTATNTVIGSIPVGRQPHNLTISGDGNTVYTANQLDSTISAVNTVTGTVTALIHVGSYPDGTALSPDGSTLWVTNLYTNDVTAINTATDTVVATIPVDVNPGSLGNFVGNGGCPSQPMTFTITIKPTAPVILVTGALAPMTTVYGTASAVDSFTVSGVNLTTGLVVTPPPGFEVSIDGSSFNPTATVDATTVTTVYLRLAATTPVSAYAGTVTVTSTGATGQNLAVPASTVTPAPLTITADDATRPYGQPNPAFTVTYSGFQNKETPSALVTPPQAATTATASSAVGDYPITPAGAEDSNYTFTYVPGTFKITLTSTAVSIPNAFTPNGDGKNDTWGIRNLSAYPNCTVTVFNRYGQIIFTSTGYGNPWNGRLDGSDVPTGTYVYLIDLGNGTKPMKGSVMVIR